jgi:hypothetical protein
MSCLSLYVVYVVMTSSFEEQDTSRFEQMFGLGCFAFVSVAYTYGVSRCVLAHPFDRRSDGTARK